MNILYEKTKLFGRPMRTADDEWWRGLIGGGGDSSSSGDFISLLSNVNEAAGGDFVSLLANLDTAGISPGDFISLLSNAGGVSGGETLSGYIDSGAASAEEAAAITKALADAKISDMTKIPKGVWDMVKGAFKKADGSTDWTKVGMAGGALLGATGLGKAEVGGYKGKIPELTAVRERINYDDLNRRPGAGGRDYFTDTKYVDSKDTAALDAAKTAAAEQAEGILAGYKKADAPKATTSIFKTPWEKAAATTGATTGATTAAATDTLPAIPNALDIAKQTYPEKFVEPAPATDNTVSTRDRPAGLGSLLASNAAPTTLAEGGPAMREPRYLRGITDGMEDKIKTSIDNKQPALLSHGEFVIPADVVSHLGNGNSDAGAKKLYQMMDRVRQARTGNKKQGKQINPDKFMPGGQVAYDQGGIVAFEAGGDTSAGVTKAGNLSEWGGDYTTQALGEAQAAAARPYEAYKGPLTAGASDLQTQAFAGVKGLAETGYTPGTFTTGTFDAGQAAKYMNPYISQALDPQLKELRRQAQISNLGTLAKAGRAGVASGASRDLMESEGMRNLLSKQSDVLGTGYANAFDKAMQQFNTEQGRSMEAQKAGEESRRASADFSRGILGDMAKLGQTQRDIEAEGIAADLKEFEAQRDYDLKMPQYKIGLLQKLPIETQTTETAMNPLVEALQSGGTLVSLLKGMGLIK